MDPITLAFIGMTGFKAVGQFLSGRSAKQAAERNAQSISRIGNANADLIDEGTDLNVEIDNFNADALHGQAVDAINRGRESEEMFRVKIKTMIGAQRAAYAGQNVDISSGSALAVQMDSAYQGELDAITIRVNASREAWGFDVAAKGERMQGEATKKLGKMQSDNTRETARENASIVRAGGSAAQSAANWGVASTIIGGGYQLAAAQRG